MSIKKLVCVLLVIATVCCCAAACGSDKDSGGVASNLSGSAEEVLAGLTGALAESGVQAPMSLPPMPVTADVSQNTMGLSEADFGKLVEDASYTMAAIGTFAHQIIVVKAVDAGAAAEIKGLVAGDGGYDAKKWICVFPERAVAVDSGAYVLIVASAGAVADVVVDAFKAAAGSTGEAEVFWEFAGGEAEGGEFEGGFGGGALILG